MACSNPCPSSFQDDFANDGICFEPYDSSTHKAKFLECHHTLCSECIGTLATILPDNKYQIICPFCQKKTYLPEEGVRGLQTNFYVERMLGISGTIEEQKKFTNTYICQKHYQPKSFYCKTCNLAICRECTVLDHKSMTGHTIVSIDEAVVATRHTLQDQVHFSHIIMNRLKAAIHETDCEVHRLDADKDLTINNLHSCIQRVQQHIDECKQKATSAISQYHKTEENELHNKRRQLQEALHLLESDVTQSEEVAKNGDINDLQTSLQKLAKINEITNTDFDLFNLIKSCFASDIMSGMTMKDNLCEIGLICLQSNLPTSVEFEVCDAIAGLTSVITVKLFDMIRNKVPFAVSFLAIYITDPWQNKLPVSLNKTHPDCTVTFTPQRSGKHVISMQYLGEKLNCNHTNIMVRSNDPVFKFGKKGNGNGTFRFPNSIRIDHNNCLYVCDPENRLIQKFTVDGEFLSQFQVDINGANCCALDMSVDEDKGIIICPVAPFTNMV